MKPLRIYLAGPIEGCTLEEALGWRQRFISHFTDYSAAGRLAVLNPMAGKAGIVPPGERITPENHHPDLRALTTSPAIFRRGVLMIQNSDILYVDLSSTLSAGKGTMFEMGMAYAAGKTIVVVCPDERLAGHPFINQSGVVFPTAEPACRFVKSILDLDIL